MAEDVVVRMIAKHLGPSIVEKQGTGGMLEAIFLYSSLMQHSCLHRNAWIEICDEWCPSGVHTGPSMVHTCPSVTRTVGSSTPSARLQMTPT